ncbi:MAG: c-type cytochrome [Bacteroidales bacterium]|nr:c-type cytochrome [Bacteroidales bacterium]
MFKRITFILGLTFLMALPISAQESDWTVPSNQKGRLSTFKFDEKSVEAGIEIYNNNCKWCHGDPGQANYQNLVPSPGDITDTKIQLNSDGELYYKIMNGRGQMPGFSMTLPSNDIWNVIGYIRSFNNEYVQEVAEKIEFAGFKGELEMLIGLNNKKVEVKLLDNFEGKRSPIAGANVGLYAKRTFGNLPLGTSESTDEEGIAQFDIPHDVLGDTAGNVMVIARPTDAAAFGGYFKDTTLAIGVPVHPVSLRAQRAMWNTVRMAPIWLLLTYALGVLIIWGFIFYVVYHFREIFIIGKIVEEQKMEDNE